jgi:quinoprotein relay system zinc metallohydrolase 2
MRFTRLTRREALWQSAAALAAPGLAGARPARARETPPLPVVEVAPGVLVHQGAHQLASAGNLGNIANIGFVVGEKAVAVIDSGGSAAGGARLRAAIRARTGLPIRWVIATHVHPDHLLGHAAFLADEPIFVGHARLPAALAARGPHYLARLEEDLGEAAAAGTEAVMPALLVEGRLQIHLGGRMLSLEAHPTAHTDNDLTVFDSLSGILWLGDLLFMERCPVIDGSLLGWLDLLETLRRRAVAGVVPGHGPVAAPWPEAADPQIAYLSAIRDGVRALLARGGRVEEAVAEVAHEAAADWLLAEHYHPRNVTTAFAELEWE